MSTAYWLAIHLPTLSVDALALPSSPSAVLERGRICASDGAAVAAGVRPGQRLATALGLCPGLLAVDRQPGLEQACLSRLACWAGQYTPSVSLQVGGLLLEIGGCLRLFGGLEKLHEQIVRSLVGQGLAAQLAGAPTPLGATWLARGAPGTLADMPGAGEGEARLTLAGGLDALPCELPAWPETVRARLQAFGFRQLGELRGLPVSSLRQRLGDRVPDDLARAYGDRPDPQSLFEFPETFRQGLELPSRVEHAESLAFAAQRLLEALAGWLRIRQQRLLRARLILVHERGTAPGELLIQPGEATADAARLLRLLRELLSRTQLPQPVYALDLLADELTVDRGDTQALFAGPGDGEGEGALACLARLRARLGESAVCHARTVAEHRPEVAAQLVNAPVPESGMRPEEGGMPASRPLWLVQPPRRLSEVRGRPCCPGPLHSLSRAERIESGWWDAGEHSQGQASPGDIRRDYFIACNAQGQRLWIYRDAEGWFLHGLFA